MAKMMSVLEEHGHEAFTVLCLLLSNARREPGDVLTTEWGALHLERGQTLVSQRGLAEALGGKHRREAARQALKKLTRAGIIVQPTPTTHLTTHPPTVVTISEYTTWVGKAGRNNPPYNPPLQPSRVNSNSRLEAKASKKEPIEPIASKPITASSKSPVVWPSGHYAVLNRWRSLRLSLWGDAQAVLLPAIDATINKGWTPERLIACVDAYAAELKRQRSTFSMRLDNFLREGNFEHYEAAPPSNPAAPAYDWANDPRLHQWDDEETEAADA